MSQTLFRFYSGFIKCLRGGVLLVLVLLFPVSVHGVWVFLFVCVCDFYLAKNKW